MQNEETKNQLIGAIYNAVKARSETFAKIAAKAYRDENPELIIETELELFCHRLYAALSAKRPGTINETQALALFTKVIASGLTFSEVANHIYVSQFPGSGGVITYHPTVDGYMHLARRAGLISNASEIVVVLQGENFSIANGKDGMLYANHEIFFEGRPKFTFDLFQVGYVYLTYPNGSRELHYVSRPRMEELRSMSKDPSRYNDESFIKTKILRHSLKYVGKEIAQFDDI